MAGKSAKQYVATDGQVFTSLKEYRKHEMLTRYTFCEKSGETLRKEPGDIEGQPFDIYNLRNCEVLVLDHTEQVSMDDVEDSRVFIAASSGSVFVRNCQNCVITVACKQLRTRECRNCEFYLYSHTEPVIEMSSDMRFAPFNGAYPEHAAHMAAAGLDVNVNPWFAVFDFNDEEKRGHNWRILSREEERPLWRPAGGDDDTALAVPRVEAGSMDVEKMHREAEGEGMQSFSIHTSMETAQAAAGIEVTSPPRASGAEAEAGTVAVPAAAPASVAAPAASTVTKKTSGVGWNPSRIGRTPAESSASTATTEASATSGADVSSKPRVGWNPSRIGQSTEAAEACERDAAEGRMPSVGWNPSRLSQKSSQDGHTASVPAADSAVSCHPTRSQPVGRSPRDKPATRIDWNADQTGSHVHSAPGSVSGIESSRPANATETVKLELALLFAVAQERGIDCLTFLSGGAPDLPSSHVEIEQLWSSIRHLASALGLDDPSNQAERDAALSDASKMLVATHFGHAVASERSSNPTAPTTPAEGVTRLQHARQQQQQQQHLQEHSQATAGGTVVDVSALIAGCRSVSNALLGLASNSPSASRNRTPRRTRRSSPSKRGSARRAVSAAPSPSRSRSPSRRNRPPAVVDQFAVPVRPWRFDQASSALVATPVREARAAAAANGVVSGDDALSPAQVHLLERRLVHHVMEVETYHMLQVFLGIVDFPRTTQLERWESIPQRAPPISAPRLLVEEVVQGMRDARVPVSRKEVMALVPRMHQLTFRTRSAADKAADVAGRKGSISKKVLRRYLAQLRMESHTLRKEGLQVVRAAASSSPAPMTNSRALVLATTPRTSGRAATGATGSTGKKQQRLRRRVEWIASKNKSRKAAEAKRQATFDALLGGEFHSSFRDAAEDFMSRFNALPLSPLPDELIRDEVAIRLLMWTLDADGTRECVHKCNARTIHYQKLGGLAAVEEAQQNQRLGGMSRNNGEGDDGSDNPYGDDEDFEDGDAGGASGGASQLDPAVMLVSLSLLQAEVGHVINMTGAAENGADADSGGEETKRPERSDSPPTGEAQAADDLAKIREHCRREVVQEKWRAMMESEHGAVSGVPAGREVSRSLFEKYWLYLLQEFEESFPAGASDSLNARVQTSSFVQFVEDRLETQKRKLGELVAREQQRTRVARNLAAQNASALAETEAAGGVNGFGNNSEAIVAASAAGCNTAQGGLYIVVDSVVAPLERYLQELVKQRTDAQRTQNTAAAKRRAAMKNARSAASGSRPAPDEAVRTRRLRHLLIEIRQRKRSMLEESARLQQQIAMQGMVSTPGQNDENMRPSVTSTSFVAAAKFPPVVRKRTFDRHMGPVASALRAESLVPDFVHTFARVLDGTTRSSYSSSGSADDDAFLSTLTSSDPATVLKAMAYGSLPVFVNEQGAAQLIHALKRRKKAAKNKNFRTWTNQKGRERRRRWKRETSEKKVKLLEQEQEKKLRQQNFDQWKSLTRRNKYLHTTAEGEKVEMPRPPAVRVIHDAPWKAVDLVPSTAAEEEDDEDADGTLDGFDDADAVASLA